MNLPEDQDLRRLFHEAHRDDTRAPSFETLWDRAHAAASPRSKSPRLLRPALVGALVAVVLTLGILWSLQVSDFSPGDPTAALAKADWDRTWSGWEGPLDFLLDTPGRTYLESIPTILTDEPSSLEAVWELERSATDAL